MDFRWWVLLAGVVLLASGMFTSDSSVARARLRERHDSTRKEFGEGIADIVRGDRNREETAKEAILGGFTRLSRMFWGVVLIAAALAWHRIGAFLGQWFTPVP